MDVFGFGTKYEQGEQVSTFVFQGEANSVPCDVQRNWRLMGAHVTNEETTNRQK